MDSDMRVQRTIKGQFKDNILNKGHLQGCTEQQRNNLTKTSKNGDQ